MRRSFAMHRPADRASRAGVPCLVALLVAASLAPAEDRIARDGSGKADASRLEANRKRWQALPPERRQRLEAIQRRLQDLPEEERQQLLDRLRRLDTGSRREALRRARERAGAADLDADLERERRIAARRELHRLPAPLRERLERLPPAERRQAVAALLAERSRQVLGELPPRVRERVEHLPSSERLPALLRLRAERLARRVFLDAEELARLRQLPHRRVLRALRAGPREAPRARPPFLTEATWSRWLAVPEHERLAVLGAILRPAATGDRSGSRPR